jgi:2-phospho-L-lactate/phosphoenolpyruvate guanylyltransferase
MRTAAILPVKRFSLAKQRLGATVADPLRLELARAMVEDVLVALARTAGIDQTIVVTDEGEVADAARRSGARLLSDADGAGQSAAVARGVETARELGFERVLCVPGDCPALNPRELEGLLAEQRAGAGRSVVIIPDRHGTGTNGLLLAPPDAITPSFGPGSCERHRSLASLAGAEHRVAELPSLLLDIDTGSDLRALRARLASEPAGAARTRAVLAASAPPLLSSSAA